MTRATDFGPLAPVRLKPDTTVLFVLFFSVSQCLCGPSLLLGV